MNLQAEKFRLIEWLVQVEDVQIIQQIGELKKLSAIANYEAQLKPMTINELKARVAAAEDDIALGRVHDVDEVLQELG